MSLTVHLIGKSRTDDEGLLDAEAMVRRDLLEQHGLCCQAQALDRSPTERSGPDRGRSDHPAARGEGHPDIKLCRSGMPLSDPPLTMYASHRDHSQGQRMGQSCLRASLITCVIALAATVSSVHAATAPCPDPGAICNIQCYNSPYCTVWRACWVTESGIGVCSPVRYGQAPRYHGRR
jgi:hypothetical protein